MMRDRFGLKLFFSVLIVLVAFFFREVKAFAVENEEDKGQQEAVTINFLGDSITEGDGLTDKSDSYANQIGKKDGIVVNNYGLSGSAVCGNNVDRFIDRYSKMEKGADVIVVLGGTNDYKGAADKSTNLGLPGSTSILDFYGGYAKLIAGIRSKYPESKLVLCTPITRTNYKSSNSYGSYLGDYAHAIMYLGRVYNVPVIDLYHSPEVDFATNSQYLSDGLHPNKEGHAVLANKVYSELLALGYVK